MQPHHFTVDVEEYFQVLALEPYVPRSRWDAMPWRLRFGIDALLEVLSESRTRATFFTLGWIAERQPEVVRQIAESGHEIASHGSDHRRVTELTRNEFRESVRSSKALLENLIGRSVVGYRAPNFSIVRGREWALEILLDEGYRYDSSLFPVRRRGSGFPGGKRDPHRLLIKGRRLHEIPPATLAIGKAVIPAGGGAYLRHLPYSLVNCALRAAERRGVPATIYIHPWELDPEQPRIATSLFAKARHYGGLRRSLPRVRRLLSSFRFQPIAQTLEFGEALPAPPASVAG